jgi:hypothetical protein
MIDATIKRLTTHRTKNSQKDSLLQAAQVLAGILQSKSTSIQPAQEKIKLCNYFYTIKWMLQRIPLLHPRRSGRDTQSHQSRIWKFLAWTTDTSPLFKSKLNIGLSKIFRPEFRSHSKKKSVSKALQFQTYFVFLPLEQSYFVLLKFF